MADLWQPDPTENWAEEGLPDAKSSFIVEQAMVNDDVVQTQSESAGNLDPMYEWVPWDRALRARGRSAALLISILGSALLAFFAAMVTRQAIQAKGSGIPEVRASVAGFALPKHFCANTLMGKITGLSFCVGSGLAVGKEGPMIHIGACWGSMLAGPISRWGGLTSTVLAVTELICVGAAAGVSAAFGAPLAGVLFAVEELGTQTPGGLRYSTMLCAFGSAVMASLLLKYLDLTQSHRLTLFEVDYKQAWEPMEAGMFCFLGVLGGLVGGVFIWINKSIHLRRTRSPKDRFCWFLPARVDSGLKFLLRMPSGGDSRVLEIVLLAIITCVSNFPRTLTRIPQNDAIFALFSQCHADPSSVEAPLTGHTIHDPIGLCATQNTPNLGIVFLLIAATCIRFMQTSVTFGAMVPAGLFVPSLFMGGCIGRLVGVLLRFAGFNIEPGIYGMVGAGAVLAGVSRLTISLVVVLFELTGGLTYIVPFMIAVLTAKWVGDIMTDGQSVYDVHAEMNGMCKVEVEDDARLLNITMEDLCGLNEENKNAHSGDAEEQSEHPVLWTSGGFVRVSDLATHCSVAAGGFVVLATDAIGDVTVLGWADSKKILAILGGAGADASGGLKAERWCNLASLALREVLKVRCAPGRLPAGLGGVGGKPWGGVVEDLSDMLDTRGVVRIRQECAILTALCITQRCPAVKAFVSVDGPHYAARTVSREHFLAKLVSGRVCPIPA
jgi:H+/Cl- antiporter ClcA